MAFSALPETPKIRPCDLDFELDILDKFLLPPPALDWSAEEDYLMFDVQDREALKWGISPALNSLQVFATSDSRCRSIASEAAAIDAVCSKRQVVQSDTAHSAEDEQGAKSPKAELPFSINFLDDRSEPPSTCASTPS
eukprot:gb/GFBE01006580.1/.p1 GENE.gb/GFBE01006580.1/~~gb/GFBE01006580.1/.p1  ORF type:complete len:138 (+),score=21.48 gb/GFBE01006580.1/:1-414(+)